MALTMQQAANEWAASHPLFMEKLTACLEEGLVVAPFSSQRAYMGACACGVPMPRQPDDIDLRTPHFEEVVKKLGANVEDYSIRTACDDGTEMELYARRATVAIGPDTIEFMKPKGPVRIGKLLFESAFTEEHIGNLVTHETDYGPLPVDDIGTLLIYSLRQGRKKCDLAKAALVLATTTPANQLAFDWQIVALANDRMTDFHRKVVERAQCLVRERVALAA
ncbi:hypothetical protein IRY61_00400 [Candidatus Saccharibacteria bacterium]|nr:hypothetical protein [Candidatus Saccharibacteria bacterium]